MKLVIAYVVRSNMSDNPLLIICTSIIKEESGRNGVIHLTSQYMLEHGSPSDKFKATFRALSVLRTRHHSCLLGH